MIDFTTQLRASDCKLCNEAADIIETLHRKIGGRPRKWANDRERWAHHNARRKLAKRPAATE